MHGAVGFGEMPELSKRISSLPNLKTLPRGTKIDAVRSSVPEAGHDTIKAAFRLLPNWVLFFLLFDFSLRAQRLPSIINTQNRDSDRGIVFAG
jgi:hypothetical protein